MKIIGISRAPKLREIGGESHQCVIDFVNLNVSRLT